MNLPNVRQPTWKLIKSIIFIILLGFFNSCVLLPLILLVIWNSAQQTELPLFSKKWNNEIEYWNTGIPQFTTAMQARISIISHDGHKSKHPCGQPNFMIFFVMVIKWTLHSLSELMYSYGCFLLGTDWKGQHLWSCNIINHVT